MKRWTREFEHRGRRHRAEFIQRPFREGLEVRLTAAGEVICLAELGLGEQALVARLKAELDRLESSTKTDLCR